MWVSTGILGLLCNSILKIKTYIIQGLATYILFVIIFPIIYERSQWAFGNCQPAIGLCSGAENVNPTSKWWEQHRYDSLNEFWGASLVCFIVGAFQLISGIIMLNTFGEINSENVEVKQTP